MNAITDSLLTRDDDHRFRITSRIEIVSELRAALAEGALLTLTFGPGNDSALSKLLEVDAEENTLILDACQNRHDNTKVCAAGAITAEAMVRRIRVRFEVSVATPVDYEGRPALRLSIPDSIQRIQRREAYRIDTPTNEVVNCRFVHPVLPHREVALRVADISVRGMGLTADYGLWSAPVGEIIKACRIDLPDTGVVHCDAQIVRVFECPGGGKHRLWIGCQFVQIAGPATTLLQRYILQLERARIARTRGISTTPAYS